MRIFTFLAGAAAGYIFGTRSGRESYDKMKVSARDLWEDPRTQEKLSGLGETLKQKAPEVSAAVGAAATSVAHKVKETAGSVTHGNAEPPAQDHVSDPALATDPGHDWSDEGGATPTGPAAAR
jgi:hypothetical protein